MKYYRRGLVLLLCFVLLLGLSMQAFAAERIDPERETALTLHFVYGETDIPDTTFRLYHLADVDSGAHFTLTSRFANYPISVEHQTTEGWKELAQTLKGYVVADRLTADYTGTTNEQGSVRFAPLKTGLYFVLGEKTAFDGYVYTIEPTIVALPNLVNDKWLYDCTINPKSTREQEPVPVTEIKVMKAWEDAKAESHRPTSITVKLLKDSAVYDTVTLSKSNSWRYIWENLPEKDDRGMPIEWSVAEEPVTDYSVRIQRTDNVFTVVNTYDGPLPPSPPLPQTGQLWWPVPVLAFLGLCFIAVGALISRRKNQE